MGHINHNDLQKMVKEGLVKGIDLDLTSTPDFCKTCVEAKATRKPFPKRSTTESVKAYGDKVMADVWGPAEVESLGHKKYYLLLQDQKSHEEQVYFMPTNLKLWTIISGTKPGQRFNGTYLQSKPLAPTMAANSSQKILWTTSSGKELFVT
jgi:hypothetical protein